MKLILILIILTNFSGCQSSKLPSVKYSQYNYHKSYTLIDDELKIELGNPLNSPLRIWIQSTDKDLQSRFTNINPIELNALTDTIIFIPNKNKTSSKLTFASRLGSTSKKLKKTKLELPFIAGKEYKIIQGNDTKYTHNTDWSRFAVDFDLKENDTICAATNGFVVGVIDKYKFGGKEDKWKPFGNYITIYDPNSGFFTQYVHLTQNGSLVKIGQKIKSGQPIALSGKTGQTDIEHLHFNCLIPVNNNDGLKSVPFEFFEGYNSKDLKRNDQIIKSRNTNVKK
jgi:murein DD-endopeptidase MepM/ murein hydrolase activator NlpD